MPGPGPGAKTQALVPGPRFGASIQDKPYL